MVYADNKKNIGQPYYIIDLMLRGEAIVKDKRMCQREGDREWEGL